MLYPNLLFLNHIYGFETLFEFATIPSLPAKAGAPKGYCIFLR